MSRCPQPQQLLRYLTIFLTFFSTPALAVDWAWQLESATMFESVIAVQHDDGVLNRYQFQCNLTDALNEASETSPTIETATPNSHPEGLLIVTCYQGAHAEVIEMIDPIENASVYKKIGSYFVDWFIKDGIITIEYDTPCKETKETTCTDPDNQFMTITHTWP